MSLKEGITDQVNATITKEPWEQDWVIIFYMYSVFIHHIQQQQLHSPNYFLKHYFFSWYITKLSIMLYFQFFICTLYSYISKSIDIYIYIYIITLSLSIAWSTPRRVAPLSQIHIRTPLVLVSNTPPRIWMLNYFPTKGYRKK